MPLNHDQQQSSNSYVLSIGIPTLLRPEDILNVSIQSQEAILSSSANNDPTEDDLNPAPCTLELDKDALIDRIQQQQFHRERVGSLPNSCTPVLDDHEHDDDLDDDEDVDDEAKDEDSKRHDHKAGRIQVSLIPKWPKLPNFAQKLGDSLAF